MNDAAPNIPTARCGVLFRFVTMAIIIVWLGGFTFYAAVVIPTAHHVLGTHLEVGFITRQVTHWLNLGGALTVLALAANLWLLRCDGVLGLRPLALTWCILVMSLITLLVLHPHLDSFLDEVEHEIAHRTDFYVWHRAYLIVATIQWCAAIVHLWYVLARWSVWPRPEIMKHPN